ncbi:MAG: orotidine-5'-phosphate decarboxylase [Verrucomicrobiales bacterium]
MRYVQKLSARITQTGSSLCVGLDPRFDLIPGNAETFLRRVIEETVPFAAAFKPNIAYFEQLGSAGIQLLEKVLAFIPTEVPVILDVKRSDIGETQSAYASAYFKNWNVDAVTLNPFLGFDSLEPFLDFPGKGIYLLAVTSNAGAADIQLQRCLADGRFVFEYVQDMARRAAGRETDVGLVVGLTNASPEILSRIDDHPLLVPGLGAQGGEIRALRGPRKAPNVVNVSRGILYAEPDLNYREKARRWANLLKKNF